MKLFHRGNIFPKNLVHNREKIFLIHHACNRGFGAFDIFDVLRETLLHKSFTKNL